MPCSGQENMSFGFGPDTRINDLERKINLISGQHQRVVHVSNPADESLLCSACRVLERYGYDFDENPRLSEWWAEHKQADEERIKKEKSVQLRKEVAKKLSDKPASELTTEDIMLLREEGYL